MLIEFRVKNFKSIKDEQVFSMVYPKKKIDENEKRNIFATGFSYAPYVTDMAAIYGANGSGKTKLLEAMDFMQSFVFKSQKDMVISEKINDKLDYLPFLFSTETENAPSEFEIVFIFNDYLYQYGFVIDNEKVHEEWLYATPKTSKKQTPQKWFHRVSGDFTNKDIRKEIKGSKNDWVSEVKDNELFLSFVANRKNLEDFQKPFTWITNKLQIILYPERVSKDYSTKMILEPKEKDKIVKFINGIDRHIIDIKAKEEDFFALDKEQEEFDFFKIQGSLWDSFKSVEVFGMHKKDDGSFHALKFKEESAGTNRLFSFAAPIFDSLEGGGTLIVDELSNSLHTKLMKNVIKLFSNKEINKSQGQLIFTTHDVNAMDCLDKDQIWFTEKNNQGETNLKSLIEFKGERNVVFSKRYLTGRYGALPILGGLFDESR